MEKSLYNFHGIGYSVYLGSQEVRLEVEKDRQKNYEQSKQLVASVTNHLSR